MNKKFCVVRKQRFFVRAFTLVEMLVSMVVFTLLVAFISQVISATGKAISINATKLDAAGQARLFFDRLGADLALRPRRTDLGLVFTKSSGNDNLQFYSQVNGYPEPGDTGTPRHVASIGYRIQQTTAGRIFQLERGATGTDWGTPSPLLFAPSGPPAPKDGDFEVLADGIFRLEYCYLLNTGLRSNTANADDSNVTAIVVAVGVLPASARAFVSNSQLQQLSTALPDSQEGDDILVDWNTAMSAPGFATGLALPALQSLRLFEHTFYVP